MKPIVKDALFMLATIAGAVVLAVLIYFKASTQQFAVIGTATVVIYWLIIFGIRWMPNGNGDNNHTE